MPIHAYKCLKCGFENDELIRSSADTPTQCPSCNSEMYERQVSAHGGIQGNFGTVPKRGAGSYKRK